MDQNSTLIRGKLGLFSETGMEYNAWALFDDEKEKSAYERLHLIKPGDALVVLKPGTPDLHEIDAATFQMFLEDGRDALRQRKQAQRILFSTPALELDFECNLEDISQDERLLEMGAHFPTGSFVQRLHDYTVCGIPDMVRPDIWLNAFKNECPALLMPRQLQ